MRRRTVVTLATLTAAVTALATFSAAPGASADLVTHCVGTGGAVTVPTDLYVPPGQSCALTGTTILGNAVVDAGANLLITGGRVDGAVQVAADAYLDTTRTTVGSVVLASGGFGVFLRETRSGPVTIRARGSATTDSFLFVEKTTVAGSVGADSGEIRLDRTTQVEGDLTTTGTFYTDVHDSFVDGALSIRTSVTGSVVCGSAIRGRATFAGNGGGVQLGPNGSLDGCASGGYWGADVSITGTTGGATTVDDNIVNGQLVATDNTPAAQVAANNRIRGGIGGQRAGAGAAHVRGARAAHKKAGDRRVQARRSSAALAATAAGDARL